MSYTETPLSHKITTLERAQREGCNVAREINTLNKLKSQEEAIAFVKFNIDNIKVGVENNGAIANIRHAISYIELTNSK